MKKSRLAIVSTALLLAVAAGCTVPSTSSSAPVSSSTSTVDAKQEALNGAAEFLYQANKDVEVTTGDFKLPAKQFYDGVSYDVEWALNVTSGPATHITLGAVGSDNFVPVTVVYDPVSSTEDVVYTLTATVKDSEGRTASTTLNRKIPAFAFTSHADYLAAKKDDLLNVEGYVVGYYPVYNGTTQVFIESAKGEGYYVYKLPIRESEKVKTAKKALADAEEAKKALTETATDEEKKAADDAIKAAKEAYNAVLDEQAAEDFVSGKYIIVSGKKDIYSGTAEIVSPTYQMSTKAPVTVEPYDITSLFDDAKTISDATLVNLQGSLVTIKDVTLTTFAESNGYLNFVRNGKESYVRISSSGNVSDHDKDAKDALKANYPSKFGYKADVTGIVNQYNGAFYLMPTSKDSIKVTGTAMDPAFAVSYAKGKLEVGTTVLADLPTTVEGTGTTITWASSVDGLFAADGKFTAPAAPTETTLTATITSGTVSDTVVFEKVLVIKPEADTVATVEAAIAELASGNTGVYVLDGTIVAQDSSNRPYIMDKNGDVLFIYEKMKDLQVGEKVKLYGVGTSYNGLFQLKNPKVLSESNTTVTVDHGFPTTMTPEEFQAAATAAKTTKDLTLNGQYIRIPGLKIVTSGDYVNFQYGEGENAKVIQSLAKHDLLVADNAGKTVTVYGYYNGLSSNGEAKFVATNVVEGIDEEPVPPVVGTPAVELNTSVLFAGITGTGYADHNGEHTVGNLTVTTTDVLNGKSYFTGNEVLQFKKTTGTIVVSSTKVTKISIVVVDTYDVATDAFVVMVGDTAATATIKSVEATGIMNSKNYEFKLTTLEYVIEGEGIITIKNNTTYAKYATEIVIE